MYDDLCLCFLFAGYVENFKMDGDFLTIVHSFEAKSIAHAGIGITWIYDNKCNKNYHSVQSFYINSENRYLNVSFIWNWSNFRGVEMGGGGGGVKLIEKRITFLLVRMKRFCAMSDI